MTVSHYPNGFSNGVSVRGLPILNTYAGNVFWVDSGTGSNGNKGTFDRPFSTIDYAVGRCTANNGDIILAKPGHIETVSAAAGLALDVAGITIVFMGNDNDRARVNFTTVVGADMDVDAADITLVNPRFTAGIDALTGPIDVNAARFTMFNALYEDGTGIDTTDAVVADANADDMVIDGWTYRAGNEAGTQKQSNIQVAAATRPVLKNIKITGDFATGPIENVTAWIDALLENVNIDNANTSPTVCVLLQATSTGSMRYCTFRVASGTTYITANNDMQLYECFGTGTDATTGEKVGTQLAGDIEAKIDVIDGYFDVPAADATADATMRDVIGKKDDAAVTTVGTTKSLMGYIKGLFSWIGTIVNTGGTATIGGVLGDVSNTSIATRLANLKTTTDQIEVTSLSATPTAGSLSRFVASGGTALGTQLPDSKSLYDMTRAFGNGYLVAKAYADLTGYDTAAAFTVTGDVAVRVIGVVGAQAITSTSGTTTLAVGTTELTTGIIAASNIDNSQFAATDVWVDSTPANDVEVMASAAWNIIGGGADIILTRSVDDITAGSLTLYCWWTPLSSDGDVVAA